MLWSSEDLYFWKSCQLLFLGFGHFISLVLGLARSRLNTAPMQFHSDMNESNVCSIGEGWDHGYDRPQAIQDPCSVIIWRGFCYQVRATVATWYKALACSEPTWLIQMCSGIFWWVNFVWGDAVLIIIIGCWDFQHFFLQCHNTDTKSMLWALVTLREMETPGQIWSKDLVLIVMVYAWQDPESITWGMYLFLATQCWTFGTILGYEVLLDAPQAAVFNIHFFSETFATLFHSIKT